MKGVWKALIPPEEPNEVPDQNVIIEEIVKLGNDLDFNLTAEEVKGCLEFDEKNLENEDIQEIAQSRPYENVDEEKKEEKEEEEADENLAELNMKQLNEIIKTSQALSDLVEDLDPMLERQSKIKSGLKDLFKSYKEEAKEKSKKKQKKVTDFFLQTPAQNSEQDFELQLSSSDED